MREGRTYLDWNATTPLRPCVREAMGAVLDLSGNPSSVHAEGREAAMALGRARERVAALMRVAADRVVFTSGGTEANALAIRPDLYDRILISAIEHDSVAAAARSGAACVEEIPVDRDGRIDLAALEALLSIGDDARTLVSVMAANNEVGTIEPIAEVARLARAHGAVSHCDAVQALGKLPLDRDFLGADMVTISAHKIGGPKGVGALVLGDGVEIVPRQVGGGQERKRRAGTENLIGIVGFGAAAEALAAAPDDWAPIIRLRDRLEAFVANSVPDGTDDGVVIVRPAERLANTTAIALPGMKAETMVMMLDLAGVAVSAGSACSSGKVRPSHVLTAMGYSKEVAAGAIRVSLGWTTQGADIDAFCKAWTSVLHRGQAARKNRNDRQVA